MCIESRPKVRADAEVMMTDDIDKMKEICFILLNSEDQNEVKAAYDEISMKCCTNNDEKRDKVFDSILRSGAISAVLMSLRKWIDSQYVVAQGLSAVHNSSLSEEIAQRYVSQDGFELLIACMNKYPKNNYLQTRGCGAVGMMIKMNDPKTMIPLIKEQKAHSVFLQAMDTHTDDRKLNRWAFKGIDILTSIGALKDYYLNECGLLSSISKSFERCRQFEQDEFTDDIYNFAWSSILHLK